MNPEEAIRLRDKLRGLVTMQSSDETDTLVEVLRAIIDHLEDV